MRRTTFELPGGANLQPPLRGHTMLCRAQKTRLSIRLAYFMKTTMSGRTRSATQNSSSLGTATQTASSQTRSVLSVLFTRRGTQWRGKK